MLEIRSTVPLRMSRDSSSLCRILLRLLSRHSPFSVCKHTHTQTHVYLLSSGVLKAHFRSSVIFTAPPGSPCLGSAPAGCSPQPGCGRAPPPAASASGCTDHSGKPGRSERRQSESENNITLLRFLMQPHILLLTLCWVLSLDAEEKLYFIQLCL